MQSIAQSVPRTCPHWRIACVNAPRTGSPGTRRIRRKLLAYPFVIAERVAQWVDQYRVVMVDPVDHPGADGAALRAAAEAQRFEHGSDYIEAVSGDLVDFIGVTETKVAQLSELSDLPNEVREEIQAAIGKEAEEDFIGGRGPHDDWRAREGKSA